jgi:hypothetical protein
MRILYTELIEKYESRYINHRYYWCYEDRLYDVYVDKNDTSYVFLEEVRVG